MKRSTFAWLVVACTVIAWPTFADAQDQVTPAPVRVGSGVRPPMKTRHVNPVYPREALAAGVQGLVILDAVIGVDGKVRDAKVVRSVPELDASAMDAVRQWEFEPTLRDGVAVPVIMTVTVNFSLGSRPGSPVSGMILVHQQRRPDGLAIWEIPAARASGLAVWNSRAGQPPLSLTQAMTTGEAWLGKQFPEARTFDLAGAILTRLQHAALPGRWFYFLTYDPVPAAQRLPSSSLGVVVLMDGTVVEPRIELPR